MTLSEQSKVIKAIKVQETNIKPDELPVYILALRYNDGVYIVKLKPCLLEPIFIALLL